MLTYHRAVATVVVVVCVCVGGEGAGRTCPSQIVTDQLVLYQPGEHIMRITLLCALLDF